MASGYLRSIANGKKNFVKVNRQWRSTRVGVFIGGNESLGMQANSYFHANYHAGSVSESNSLVHKSAAKGLLIMLEVSVKPTHWHNEVVWHPVLPEANG